MAKEFNEIVSIDLREVDGDRYSTGLIMLRDSAGTIIKGKTKYLIVDRFFKHWIRTFGYSKKILSDNGREFNNTLFVE